jgi:hypothetical protein
VPRKSRQAHPFGQLLLNHQGRSIAGMIRARTPFAALATLAVATMAVTAGSAQARITVLDDDAATIARAMAPRPGGGSGLRLDDNLNLLSTTTPVLPRSRQAARVSGRAATASAPTLIGQGPLGMAAILRERVRTSGAHRVFVDDLGPEFAGQEGDDLAQALAILAGERPAYATRGVSRRVHLYVSAPGPLLSDPGWAGARTALARSGGVWLKTFAEETEWTPAEWLAWPAEAAARLGPAAAARGRVHVVFTGRGRQATMWDLARTGSACDALSNGPAGYGLGADVDDFVAEYRRTLPFASSAKLPATGCTAAPSLAAAGVRGLEHATDLEATGVEIPPGGLITPPLPAGDAAQLTLQLGSDPLGLAAALGVSSEAFWAAAQARLEVRGPGVATDATIAGDGAARLDFTPTAPGPVVMQVVIDRGLITRALGGEPDLVRSLHAADARPELIQRVAGDPSGWQLAIPLVTPGGAPGSAVLEIVPPPT